MPGRTEMKRVVWGGEGWSAFGSKLPVHSRSAGQRLDARAAAAPPFSGPRSRGTLAACNAQPHQHRCALQSLRGPRMGPAPRGTTAPLLHLTVACDAFACHPGAGAGGLGYGRRPHSRCQRPAHENTVLMAQRSQAAYGAPRAWAGERTPGHLPLLHRCTHTAANRACRAALYDTPIADVRAAATGRKRATPGSGASDPRGARNALEQPT